MCGVKAQKEGALKQNKSLRPLQSIRSPRGRTPKSVLNPQVIPTGMIENLREC